MCIELNELEEEIEVEKEKVKYTPFLKWAGGKKKVFHLLKPYFPKIYSSRFIEPFLGAGAVALNVDYDYKIVNDLNKDLISVWQALQKEKHSFVNQCEELFTLENWTTDAYYALREEFNTCNDTHRKAILFVYLNRHCFNGICRYNSTGGFNVPMGRNVTRPYFPREEFESFIARSDQFTIRSSDFRKIFEGIKQGDVVYADPPYFPTSATSNFDTYQAEGFGLKDHLDLAKCAHDASYKGATVIISNHYNWYTSELYGKMYNAKIKKISVARTISCNGDERKAIEEVIAIFYPKF